MQWHMTRYGIGILLLCVLSSGATQAAPSLKEQLRGLSTQRGFSIEGLNRIGDEPPGNAEGNPINQVRHLLQDYNFVLTQTPTGGIDTVRIISRRGESGPKSSSTGAYIETRRVGAHHQVEATLIGPNSILKSVPLLVDTGATTIVLPTSMIQELGFVPEDLQEGTSQTASGTVPIKTGLLRIIRVGGVSATDVEVSFIADSKLMGNRLLGMSFLQRFKMTIDDAKNELILMAR
jgi:aspartyl protease family protein